LWSLSSIPGGRDILAPMRRWQPYVLLGITAVAAIVRFATLDGQSFDHDEAVTAARVIHPSLFDTLSVVAHGERSPPLYYVLAWGWSKIFGTGEIGLRSLSALFGTLTVPLAYLAACELVSRRRIAILAAAFVALNPYLVWYSQEARSYALMVLFVTLAFVFFARSVNRPEPRSLALWAAASALAVASHYFAAFLIGPEAIWLLIGKTRRRAAMLAVATVLAVGLTLIPLALSQEDSGRRNGFTQTPLAPRMEESALNFVASEEPAPFAASTEIDALQAVAAICGALLLLTAVFLISTRSSPDEQSAAMIIGTVSAAAIGVPLLLAIGGIDFINPRNLIGALVPLLLLLAVAFGLRGAGWTGQIAAWITCLLFGAVLLAANVSAQMQRPDWRGAAQALESSPQTRILVVPHNGDDPLSYYLGAHKPGPGIKRVRTSEIAVLSTNYDVTAPPGFKLVHSEGRARIFILWQYEAKHPRPVLLRRLADGRVLNERSSILVSGGD
jgi:mannosyltransferase